MSYRLSTTIIVAQTTNSVARDTRLEDGNYGDCEPVGEGISELRMFFGPGYMVYFGENGNDIVILLCGGDKDSQDAV
jgi:putative addiction module killer protein